MAQVEIVNEVDEKMGFFKRAKDFAEAHVGEIMTAVGGVCVLLAAILNMNEGNSYIYTTSSDGDVYKVRAKKEKTVKTVDAVKHTATVNESNND